MNNVMLTFLGTTNYLPCNYLLNGKKISNVRFVQEALVSTLCREWKEEDKIVIFLTKEAKNKNWVDNGHQDRDGKPLQKEGLKYRLELLDLKTNIVTRDIPNGSSSEEIWQIFNIIFNEINNCDEVIFDITHAFRSLPMLAIIILNYAKALKDIKIKGMYYGAFESLGTIYEVKEMADKARNAPIFNLTSFIYLSNWTSAINDFLTYSDAKKINKLTKEKITPILKHTKGKNENAQNLKKLANRLEKLTELIQTSRGLSVLEDFDFNNLKELINSNKGSILEPLNPLLGRISDKIKNFNNNEVENGYGAVEWCIKHNLTQQGYTILQETMISEVIVKHLEVNEIDNKKKRKLVSQAINIKSKKISENEWKEPAKSNRDDVLSIISGLDDEFVKTYDAVSQYRNDINHAGFSEKPHNPTEIKKNLKNYYEKLRGGTKDV